MSIDDRRKIFEIKSVDWLSRLLSHHSVSLLWPDQHTRVETREHNGNVTFGINHLWKQSSTYSGKWSAIYSQPVPIFLIFAPMSHQRGTAGVPKYPSDTPSGPLVSPNVSLISQSAPLLFPNVPVFSSSATMASTPSGKNKPSASKKGPCRIHRLSIWKYCAWDTCVASQCGCLMIPQLISVDKILLLLSLKKKLLYIMIEWQLHRQAAVYLRSINYSHKIFSSNHRLSWSILSLTAASTTTFAHTSLQSKTLTLTSECAAISQNLHS